MDITKAPYKHKVFNLLNNELLSLLIRVAYYGSRRVIVILTNYIAKIHLMTGMCTQKIYSNTGKNQGDHA